MNSDLTVIFSRERTANSLTTKDNDCLFEGTTPFDKAILLSILLKNIHANCATITNASYFGYSEDVDPYGFQVTVDVRSFATVIARNLEIISLNALNKVTLSDSNFTLLILLMRDIKE
jgi:hypothetical protein